MKPLFTVHVGEYLVGSYIEQHYKRVSVWIPSRDTGVDLMVSDRRGRSTVSIQVKFSKDFLPTHVAPEFREPLRVCAFFLINRDKLRASHVRARLKDSTEWHETLLADVFTFRNGKAIQMRAFADRRQALEWAGVKGSDAN